MKKSEQRKALKEFRKRKAEFRASLPGRSSYRLTTMILDPQVAEQMDLDDDDDRLILHELESRGIELFGGDMVSPEEMMRIMEEDEELYSAGRRGLLH